MYKLILIICLLILPIQVQAVQCPPELDDTGCNIYKRNNAFIVPEQWGFRSNMSMKQSYLIDMQPQWEQTKDEWTNTYNKKPIQSNLRRTVGQIVVYPNQFKSFYIPRQVTNYLP